MRTRIVIGAVLLGAVIPPSAAIAQDAADLAQDLANPLAAIISVPLQLNYDQNIGVAGQGSRTTLNLQPVVPFALGNGANIITRTIIPYVWQEDVIPGTSQEGFGDVLFSAWYSRTTESNLTWGIGPVVRIPTGSDVSTDTWAAGITGISLQQTGPWTYGALANHLWDLESTPHDPHQRNLCPALPGLLDRGCLDLLASERNLLRLGKRRVVGAGQRVRLPACGHRWPSRELPGGGRVLAG